MPGLGRRHAPDSRDRNHLMLARLPLVVPPRPIRKRWTLNWKGDQGASSACVGYGWHGLLRALPHLQREPLPTYIYEEAKKLDEWPGEHYDGTSVRAGAKVLKAAGKITAYAWAFDLETVLNWTAFHGPVVVGINWYASMSQPDAQGLVSVGGAIEGGHCCVIINYDDRTERVGFQNSWGTAWSIHGRFWMHYADVDRLIREDGEACTPTE